MLHENLGIFWLEDAMRSCKEKPGPYVIWQPRVPFLPCPDTGAKLLPSRDAPAAPPRDAGRQQRAFKQRQQRWSRELGF